MQKVKMLLSAIFICLILQKSFSEIITEENIVDTLEFSSEENKDAIFFALIDFLSPKWNLDKSYASQVLGYLYGFISETDLSVEEINTQKMKLANYRLRTYIDLMLAGKNDEIYNRLIIDKYNTLTFAWFYYFGSNSNNYLIQVISIYSESSDPDDSLIFTFRYYYERHDEVARIVQDNKSVFFEAVKGKTYKEWEKEYEEKLRTRK